MVCCMGASDAMLFHCRPFWCLNSENGFNDVEFCYMWQRSWYIGMRVALVCAFGVCSYLGAVGLFANAVTQGVLTL